MSGDKAERTEQRQEGEAKQGEGLSKQVFAEMQESRLNAAARDSGDTKGSREVKEDGAVVSSNADGQITKVEHPNGTSYEYEYSSNGKLRTAKVTGADGDSDYWVKSRDGQWRSYDEYHGPGDKRNKPGNLQLSGGDWEINADGRMTHSSGAVTQVAESRRKK